ncbi:MAG: Mur ligase family protein [Gammaproteobacteria bacterium]|nr:Mur ligase family protein [Gammaproteobacteria bacterium]
MDIPQLDCERLIVDSCRRLTGPSLVWSHGGAILDVLIDEVDPDALLECWYRQVDALLQKVGWSAPELTHRRFDNGVSLLLAAPVDQLYSATSVLQTAWYFCACELLGITPEAGDALTRSIIDEMRGERNPGLVALQRAAAEHGVDCLVDDDRVTIGHGNGSRSFQMDELPDPQQLDWAALHDIPVALVTGTNGKSTSVRLLDAIARAAGRVSGITSTDFVRVGDDLLDRGDCSGPASARLLLRDPRLEVAFLEVARGGILRRGLAVRRAAAALVTNVARDHLGQYGVNSMAALTATKFAVAKGLGETGLLVTNADDAGIVDYLAQHPQQNLCWFAIDADNPVIRQQRAHNGPCCFTEGGDILRFDGEALHRICAIDAVPMTLGGAARHNVQNALGAVGVASAMGFSDADIRAGLEHFHSDESDNPGRMNIFALQNSARVIVDFAHNAHGVAAVVDTARRMPAARKWALFGSAGDRSDAEIAAIASGICAIEPDRVVITELEHYLRGRKPGEVSTIMQRACLEHGLAPEQIHIADSPLAGARFALEQMHADDLGLFLVLSEREQVVELLNSM